MIGEIHGKDALFFREQVGTAKDAEGNDYEMTTGVGNGAPIVQNKKTGLWFTLSWADILNLAKKAGIDGPPKVKRARCPKCPATIKGNADLARHREIVHGEKP